MATSNVESAQNRKIKIPGLFQPYLYFLPSQSYIWQVDSNLSGVLIMRSFCFSPIIFMIGLPEIPIILAFVSNQAWVSPQGISVLGMDQGLVLIWNGMPF